MGKLRTKLKYLYQRITKEGIGIQESALEISRRTGFPTYDIKQILSIYSDIILETLDKKETFRLKNVCKIYPTIKPGKNVVKLNKHVDKDVELMYMPTRWTVGAKFFPEVKKMLLKTPPTEEEIDNIYID